MATKTRTNCSTKPKASDTPALDRVNAYATAVLSGEEIAGPLVRAACRRHFDDLKKGKARGFTWNDAVANKVLRFFEERLKLSEGQFEGVPFKLHPSQAFKLGSLYGWVRDDGSRRYRTAYIEEGKGNGKALALDTPIPTPSGWTTMGALRAGDEVLDDNGRPCLVLVAHPVSEDRECFEVVFDDGETIVASAEHLWRTEHRRPKPGGVTLKTTAEIAGTLRNANGKYQSANHSVSLCGAFDLPDANLSIHPYVLGAWLGDGDSDCARMTCAFSDIGVMEEIAASGQPYTAQSKHGDTTGRFGLNSGRGVRGDTMQERLRALDLIGNKHIPSGYLRGSKAQRLNLLQGLMDTDGSIATSGQCEFTATNKNLADGVLELVLSLGIKATMICGDATLNGRWVSKKYRVMFAAPWGVSVFRLERKRDRQAKAHGRRRLSGDRRIVSCERVPSVPVRCITVSSSSSMFLCGRAMVPTHNSPFAGGVGLYGLLADSEPGAQVYAAAAKKDQADILFRDAVKMRDKAPALAARITTSGGPGKEYNMAHLASGSFFRPISKEAGKSGSGPRPHYALCDEVHEHPDRMVMEMLQRGFKFRRQPLLLMITNSGSDRNSVCWEERDRAVKVVCGTRTPDDDYTYVGEAWDGSDSVFAYICALDKDDDPLKDRTCWKKANPLLGTILTEEYLAGVVAEARNVPGKLNNILRLHFCCWTESDTSWLARDLIDAVMVDFDPAMHDGRTIDAAGLDLSGAKDLTAAAFVVETGTVPVTREDGSVVDLPTYDAWIEAWTPGDTLDEREKADHTPYRKWVEGGYLNAPPGQRIRYDHVAAHFARLNASSAIRVLAFDKYVFDKFETELDNYGVDIPSVAHPQGGQRRAKPDPAKVEAAKAAGDETPLGLWMPGSITALETLILEKRIRLRKSPVLMTALMGVAMETDPLMNNQWFSKKKSTVRIDPAVALVMAVGAAVDGAAPQTKSFWEVLDPTQQY